MASIFLLSDIVKMETLPNELKKDLYIMCDQQNVPVKVLNMLSGINVNYVELRENSDLIIGTVIGIAMTKSNEKIKIYSSDNRFNILAKAYPEHITISTAVKSKKAPKKKEQPKVTDASINKTHITEKAETSKKRSRKSISKLAMNPPVSEPDPLEETAEFEVKAENKKPRKKNDIPPEFKTLLDKTKISELALAANRNSNEVYKRIFSAVKEAQEPVSLGIQLRVKLLDVQLSDNILKELEKNFKEIKKAATNV